MWRWLKIDLKNKMPVQKFQDAEIEYQNWLAINPCGYVLVTTRDVSLSHMSLHRASCRMISQYMKNMAKDAFTGRGYIKICSTNHADLSDWIKVQGGSRFTKLCSICNPNVSERSIIDGAHQLLFEFEAEVRSSISLTLEERRKRLCNAARHPKRTVVTTTIFQRNPDVVAEVLYRAQGVCERCKQIAPFMRAVDGTPYLEVHHIQPLSENGEDTVKNAIALCPNCHRYKHYG